MNKENNFKKTVKPYIFFIFSLLIVGATFMLYIRINSGSIGGNNIIQQDTLKVIQQDTLEKELGTTLFLENKQNLDSTKNEINYDDEILKVVTEAQNYLLREEKKSIDILVYHEKRINKLYSITGLSDENNELLKSTRDRMRAEIKKQRNISITEDNIPIKQNTNILMDTFPE